MHDYPVSLLFVFLILLVAISGFFSAAETAMMAVNRYKLAHLVKQQHRLAEKVMHLLRRPDRLLGVVLIGNTFANSLAAMFGVLLAEQLFGRIGLAITVFSLAVSMVILIGAEVGPKTAAAMYPQRTAFIAVWPLTILLKVLYPIVWLANAVVGVFFRLFGVKQSQTHMHEQFNREELRTVLHEASGHIPGEHQEMLLRILDLETVAVESVMLPRSEIVGINLQAAWETILLQIAKSPYSRLPVFNAHIDHTEGVLNVRHAIYLMHHNKLNKSTLMSVIQPMYFIPEGTSLATQLLNFRNEKKSLGMIVDEYGEIQGMLTLEDILEEIVGEFTTNAKATRSNFKKLKDGSFVAEGSMSLRDFQRISRWELPSEEANTLSGLITEYLQDIPQPGLSVLIAGHPIDILEVEDNTVKKLRVLPKNLPE